MRVLSVNTMHFWHHMMAEFFPVIACLVDLPSLPDRLFIFHPRRKWGACALDAFYSQYGAGAGIEIVLTNTAPANVPRIRQKRRWDRLKGVMHSHSLLRGAIALVKDAAKSLAKACTHDVVVQIRGDNPALKEYYETTMSGPCGQRGEARRGTQMYGRSRRSVLGMELVVPTLNKFGYRAMEYTGDSSGLLEQAATYMSASGLILEHGAGMVWMLFLPPRSPVLEISPPAMRKNLDPDMTAEFARLHYHRLYIRCHGTDPMCRGGPAVHLRDVGVRQLLRFSGFFPKGRALSPTKRANAFLTPAKVDRLLREHVARERSRSTGGGSSERTLATPSVSRPPKAEEPSVAASGCKIPKIIHQTGPRRDTSTWPSLWVACHSTWKRDYPSPEYTHRFWSDADLDVLVRRHYAEFYGPWRRLRLNIQRVDVARYLILHKFGGIYADLDYESLRNMYDTLCQDKVNVVESPYKRNEKLHNSLLASEAGRNFWVEAARTAFRRAADRKKGSDVLWTTGPRLMDELYRRGNKRVHVLEASLYQPHVCGRSSALLANRHSKSARSSAYALHHLSNSWCKSARRQKTARCRIKRCRRKCGKQSINESN